MQKAPAVKPASRTSSKQSVSLSNLLEAKLLTPGQNVLRTVYKNKNFDATLNADGSILFEGLVFHSVSAWTVHTKRLSNPDRKADDGWRCVSYVHDGRCLHDIKNQFCEGGGRGGAADAEKGASAPPPAAAPPPPPPAAAPPPPPSSLPLPAPPAAAPPSQPLPSAAPPAPPLPAAPGAREPTQYARDRPQRDRSAPQRLDPSLGDAGGGGAAAADADLVMVTPEAYGPRGGADEPPFAVFVSPSAALMMEAHAHGSTAEVIGFLGGSFDGTSRTLRIAAALPARNLVAADAAVEVELDPEAMPPILEAFESEGLCVVGWYHSHPRFATLPSVRDVANQLAYQRLFSGAPFVAAIVGPFDADNAGAVSELRWLVVEPDAGAPGGARPRQLCATPDGGETRLRSSIAAELAPAAAACAASLMATDWKAPWRGGASQRDKLRAALEARAAGREGADDTVKAIMGVVDAAAGA